MKHALRDEAGKITGFVGYPSAEADVLPIDETSGEWLEYLNPPEPTIDEVYDIALQNNAILRKLILGLNDGTFVPGSNYTNQQIKNGLK
jgi:hypothetical protein